MHYYIITPCMINNDLSITDIISLIMWYDSPYYFMILTVKT